MTLSELLLSGEASHPAVVVPGGITLTYQRLRQGAQHIGAALIARSVMAGHNVAASFTNSPEIVAAFFGTTGARATFAPLNSAYTKDEFLFYLEDIDPVLLLLAPNSVPNARAAAAALGIPVADLSIDAEGTTSRPKGVPLTNRNITASAQNIERWYELTSGDVSYCVMPLFHVHGLVFSTIAVLGAGGAVVIPEKFSASAFWPTVMRHRVSVVSAVPTILRTLLLRAGDVDAPQPGAHPLRFIRSSSSPLPASEMQRLQERFGVPVVEAYSMTEAAHQMCANPLRGDRRPGCVGVGAFVDVTILDADGNELAIGEVGEVAIRGDNVTRGYHKNDAANAAAFSNGWFRTGDYGTIDPRGYVTLVGRLKELINRGGEKISPVEVDEALISHPGVKEAVAFAMPDEKYGEAVAAALVLHDGVAVEDVLTHARGRLAPFKVPTTVHVVGEIPKTATGKVQRRVVAAAFAKDAAPAA
jgi:acyl-CoA synthetase (AMP-forming)/AMP-acid ligase II